MRLFTHTDLDGVMCAVLISCVEEVDEFRFVDPGTVQAGKIAFTNQDIISDLPYDRRCGIWFDHHESSRPKDGAKFEGAWKMAPSAARVVYDYYENPYLEKYAPAVEATDRIDSGQVTLEEAQKPQGWFLLSNTLETSAEKKEDDAYRAHVISLIRRNPDISSILTDSKVAARVKNVEAELALFSKLLRENTVMKGKVAFSDLRQHPELPRGNNYLIYSLFPDAATSVRLMPEKEDKDSIKISVGHNIYHSPKCGFDVGAAMKAIGGGGHRSVGGASVKKEEAEGIAKRIIEEINSTAQSWSF
jgi:oligoribonuclease NrnB/cAMP/cGMP phosphodiesterase (DHH superfamily)